MKNVELLVKTLEKVGVRWVFGVPSGPVLPLIEALRESPVEFVLTASETSAGFMAATVGALTGVPGTCVSTLGPGGNKYAHWRGLRLAGSISTHCHYLQCRNLLDRPARTDANRPSCPL